jgi:hypothetical protein
MSVLMVAWVGLLGSTGCKRSSGELSARAIGGDSVASDSRLSARQIIDAGIQFVDRPSFLCLPVEKLGLSASDQILAATSSCECVAPRIFFYQSSQSEIGSAVLLKFDYIEFDYSKCEELASSGAATGGMPIQLGVVLTLELADGITREFGVNLLYATQLNEAFISTAGRAVSSQMLVTR